MERALTEAAKEGAQSAGSVLMRDPVGACYHAGAATYYLGEALYDKIRSSMEQQEVRGTFEGADNTPDEERGTWQGSRD